MHIGISTRMKTFVWWILTLKNQNFDFFLNFWTFLNFFLNLHKFGPLKTFWIFLNFDFKNQNFEFFFEFTQILTKKTFWILTLKTKILTFVFNFWTFFLFFFLILTNFDKKLFEFFLNFDFKNQNFDFFLNFWTFFEFWQILA